MYTSFFLVITAASSVLGGCFSGGENWASQKSIALSKAQDICNNKFSKATWANKGQSLAGCYNLDSEKQVDFILERIQDGSRAIDAAECYNGFQKEINGCDHGGSTSYRNWKYTADPNANSCAA
ncbi:putative Ecp2 effector protein domain-containing protein [Seiridium cardinale]|uniref:Ecp2 effector protein domain-containing protein n=1 Tax=Seiridium cardinale TaxID=138064 RepID=A0ABR2Y967_9PEZI